MGAQRTNGWEVPFHALQLATWVVFPIIATMFYAFYTPILNVYAAYIATIVYTLICIVMVYATAICTGTNPADDWILEPYSTAVEDARMDDRNEYCNVCMRFVRQESRHCRLCNKCVAVFDHHCKWLNNCVGAKNYRYFLTSVVTASAMLALQIAVGIYLLVTSYTDKDTIRHRSASGYGCSINKDSESGLCTDDDYNVSIIALRVIHIVMLVILVPWCFMIMQLALFHFQLCIENLTTYDYIVRKRKQRMQRDRENLDFRPWWYKLYLRMCSKDGANADKAKRQTDNTAYRADDPATAAEIEAEVDDDLDVVSSRSGEAKTPVGADYAVDAQPREKTVQAEPTRGFGRHVQLGGNWNSDKVYDVVAHTPENKASAEDASSYHQAPQTPPLALLEERNEPRNGSFVVYSRSPRDSDETPIV